MLHEKISGAVLRAFYDVHNDLGFGFLEAVYTRALAVAMAESGLKFERHVPIPVWFRGAIVGDYRADFLVDRCVILELKVARALDDAHIAQLTNYLKATDLEVGLLLNFGTKPQFRRVFFTNDRKKGHGFNGSDG